MSATWTVIPWTILKDMTMTYGELREVLMSMDEEHLHQTVTLYCLEEDEFVPAIGTDYTDVKPLIQIYCYFILIEKLRCDTNTEIMETLFEEVQEEYSSNYATIASQRFWKQ